MRITNRELGMIWPNVVNPARASETASQFSKSRRQRLLTSPASAVLLMFDPPSAAEAGFFLGRFMARLKSCPSRALRGAEAPLFHGAARCRFVPLGLW